MLQQNYQQPVTETGWALSVGSKPVLGIRKCRKFIIQHITDLLQLASATRRKAWAVQVVLLCLYRHWTISEWHLRSARRLYIRQKATMSCSRISAMWWLLVKLFQFSSTFDWNNFILAQWKLAGNYFRSLLQLTNIFPHAQCRAIISAAETIIFQFQIWLHMKQNTEINSKLFPNNYISHVTTV